MAVFTGEIMDDKSASPAVQNEAYLEKYREGFIDIQMTPQRFSESYSVALRFKVKQIRAW